MKANLKKEKYIFIIGGSLSGIGKGIFTAALTSVLQVMNFSLIVKKVDPYLSTDTGFMNPYEHGEVFVTSDGEETDLDLGHYQRFSCLKMDKWSSITSGKIYSSLISKEREGLFLGQTVRVIPHLVNEITSWIKKINGSLENKDVDSETIYLVELGGVAGDIEASSFLEAIRQIKFNSPADSLIIHLAPIIRWNSTKEIKTKLVQFSTKELLQAGLVHDILILRSQDDLLESELVEAKKKIARLCSISEKNIFSLSNFVNVYKIPFWIIESNLISKILSFLNKSRLLDGLIYNLNEKYSRLGLTLNQPELQPRVCRIGIFGKYSSHGDSYLSIIESLRISSFYEKVLVKVEVLDIEKLEGDLSKTLENYDGVIVAPGFGFRGSEKKIEISRQIRIKKIPFIGICLGMQLALIEFARNVLGLKGANSVEFDEKTAHPIFISENNLNVMRKGNREVEFIDNSFLHSVYEKSRSFEIHRHKYKFNLDYLEDFEKAGMFFTGRDKDTHLIVEAVEKSDFFFILTQFHPEFSTSLCSPAPIFNAFLHYIVRNRK